jgi:transmembrane sensor
MDHRPNGLEEEILISERAFEWLHLLEKASARDQQAFHKWLGRSPQNGGEVLMATSTELLMRQLFRGKRFDADRFLAASANVLAVDDHPQSPQERPRRKRLRLFAVAGFAIVAGAAALFATPALVRSSLDLHVYTTSVGEQRSIALSDGSAISINALSSVRVNYSATARDVHLSTGQARFIVAKDSTRPFRVHVLTGGRDAKSGRDMVIQAVGTKFDVKRLPNRINVAVVEGVVQVAAETSDVANAGAAPARVAAGQEVSIEDNGHISAPEPVSLPDVGVWQQRRLVLTDSMLGKLIDE